MGEEATERKGMEPVTVAGVGGVNGRVPLPFGTLPEPGRPAPARRANGSALVAVCLVLLAAGLLLLAGGWPGRERAVSGGTLTETPGGLVFENAAEHIRFTAPAGWSRYETQTAQTMVRGEGCSFGLLEQRTALPAGTMADAEAKDLARRHPDAHPVVTARMAGGQEALTFSGTYVDSAGAAMTQTYIVVDRGDNLVTLIETSTAPGCAAAFLQMERGLSI